MLLHVGKSIYQKPSTLSGQRITGLKFIKMKEKTEKMNIRFPQGFYVFLKRKAVDEHLSPSTYARKILMDSLKYNMEEDESNVSCTAEV